MAEAIRVQDGDVINIIVDTDVKGGDVWESPQSGMCGVIVNDASSGEMVGCYIEGVFRIAAKADDTITYGTKLFWNGGGKYVTGARGPGAVDIGIACSEKAAGVEGTVLVKLERFN